MRSRRSADLLFWGTGFALGMALLSVQRVLLFAVHAPAEERGGTLGEALPAFWTGLRFDAAALGYPLLLALLVATAAHLIGRRRAADRVGLVAALGLILVLAVVELFFFAEFRTRLNFVALEYLDDPFATIPLAFEFAGLFGSVAVVVGLLGAVWVGWWASGRLQRWAEQGEDNATERAPSWITRVALVVALVIAARGGLGRPLRPQDAHPSPHRFVNQLALSGGFTLGRHVYEVVKDDGRTNYRVDPAEAREVARSMFVRPGDELVDDAYPALRRREFEGEPRRLNVVVVVLESFASRFVGRLRAGPEASLTPELDALADEGVFFTRFLATGPSTNRSLPGVLGGLPCLVKRTSIPKSAVGQQELVTLGTVLRDEGYQTAFLRSGGPSWENLGGWLRSHGFEKLVNRDELDRTRAVSSAGPPDHVLFERVLAECDELATDGPFLAAMLTTTNHPPFALPDPLPDGVRERIEAVPDGPDAPRQRAVLYADWAFGDFVRHARRREWGRNTLFVAIGDHGVHFEPQADIDPDRRHVPFLLLGPVPELAPRTESRLASHVDVLPTLLGLLRIDATHAAWGSDLLDADAPPRHAVLGPHGGLPAYAITDEDGHYLVDYLDGRAELFRLDLDAGTLTPLPDDVDTVDRLRRLGRSFLSTAHSALDARRAGPLPDPR